MGSSPKLAYSRCSIHFVYLVYEEEQWLSEATVFLCQEAIPPLLLLLDLLLALPQVHHVLTVLLNTHTHIHREAWTHTHMTWWYRSIATELCVYSTAYLSESVNLRRVYVCVCVCLCNYQRVSVDSSSELFLQSLCLVPHLQFIHSATTLQHMKHFDLRSSPEFVHKQTFSANISLNG